MKPGNPSPPGQVKKSSSLAAKTAKWIIGPPQAGLTGATGA